MNEYFDVPNLNGKVATLVDVLRWRADQQPNNCACTFLLDGETNAVSITYQELDQLARSIAARLQQSNMAGKRGILLYQPGLEYVAGFLGCLYAGVTAVPVYPPDPIRLGRTLPRLQAIVADAQASVVLTTASILGLAQSVFKVAGGLKALSWLATDQVLSKEAQAWQAPRASGRDFVFFQYTSGSTATPRGVILTHANLLHNLSLIYTCFGMTPDSRVVIWLPPYHDMGLIGGILLPLYGGLPVILMSPVDFLKRPFRWLQAISRHKATASGGPNFAYDLCVRKATPDQCAGLDLSSWEVAFNGSEPVRHQTMERFVEAFAPYGFRREAFYPCYGLAESTLFVTGNQKGKAPVVQFFEEKALGDGHVKMLSANQPGSQALSSSGRAPNGLEVTVVDPEAMVRRAPGKTGEIWVRGPSVAQGYWNNPAASTHTFHGYLGDTGEGPFLRTGDLGFLLDGELFVTGRIKDLIIAYGRNYYPQDIEITVESSHSGLRAGCGAVFGIDIDGIDRVVVIQEVKKESCHGDTAEILAAIRRAVFQQHQVQPHAVVLIPPSTISKTSSGKIQRHAVKADFLNNTLKIIAQWKRDFQ